VRRCARFHTNKTTRQIGKELKNLCSTKTSADYHHTIRIDAVNLERRLRNIDADCANFTHGRLPSMWFVSTQPPYGTSMPQSGRRPPHQSRRVRDVSVMSVHPSISDMICGAANDAKGQTAT
jgi:hypothetical protein